MPKYKKNTEYILLPLSFSSCLGFCSIRYSTLYLSRIQKCINKSTNLTETHKYFYKKIYFSLIFLQANNNKRFINRRTISDFFTYLNFKYLFALFQFPSYFAILRAFFSRCLDGRNERWKEGHGFFLSMHWMRDIFSIFIIL